MAAPKTVHRLAVADVVPAVGTVLMVRDMGRLVLVRFTNHVTRLYRRGTRIYL